MVEATEARHLVGLQLRRPHEPGLGAQVREAERLPRQPAEALKNNTLATALLTRLASELGVAWFVFISTDKAINPTSVMGCSKRLAEMALQAQQAAPGNRTRFLAVRFGNVLGSSGSVIPVFRRQIAQGGPVTVTHPDMVRYFMTIREACDLVLTAATHALTPARPDVSVYVLNMGQPVKIVELAERMIRLSGLEPGIDIEVVFTGMRPGERLNEILFASEEPAVEIGVAGIMAAKPNEPPMQTLCKWLAALEEAIARDDRSTIRAVLKDAVPEFGSNAA